MAKITRRGAFGSLLGGAALAGSAAAADAKPKAGSSKTPVSEHGPADPAWSHLKWGQGFEGQRKADLGNGTFLNPIVSGDHPDPTILKDGADYYMTFSSFDAYPGVVIWHSLDLVNWQPVTAALKTPIGSVWACDLVKHNGRYFIYIPARWPDRKSTYVIWADDIRGPWSEPIDLKLPDHIDPGHVVGEDGKRYLFLSGGDMVELTDDGLSTVGKPKHVYDPWRYPEDWVVEGFSPEGPKVRRYGDWFYLITAVGGTAGPPTGHIVIAARSRSVHGPWEDHPGNPLVRTVTAREKWWSRGHASLVEGPDGGWWMVYHGYEHGFWTLGRQTLLDPIEWTKDGWFRARGGDLSKPLPIPKKTSKGGGKAVSHGQPLSDDFSKNRFGVQWNFYDPGPKEMDRVRYEDGALVVKAKGTAPRDASPLTFLAGEQAYRIEVEIELSEGAQAGVLLYYSRKLYAGLAFNADRFVMHRQGMERNVRRPDDAASYRTETPGAKPPPLKKLWLRATNDHHIATFHYSFDGKAWKKFDVQMEISGYHHNTAHDFLSVRPGVYVSGAGEARFRNLKFETLQTVGGEHGA